MTDERCAMCAEAGFPNVLAHYKAIPKGMSHDGKGSPSLCWDHKHGKTPSFVARTQNNQLETLVEQAHAEIAATKEGKEPAAGDVCGCGRKMPHKGRCAFRRLHDQPQAIAKKTPRLDKSVGSLPEVLQNLKALLEGQAAEIQRNVEAVERVLAIVNCANQAESRADFFDATAKAASVA
jgi:hypothetical protein